jgi:nitrous oxide reductase accessory protein NosL
VRVGVGGDMNVKSALAGLVLLLAVAGSGYYGYRHFILARQDCDICGRPVHSAHESTLLLKNGEKAHTCCTRCALHYDQNHPGQVADLLVMDHSSGKTVDAQKALFVEGSEEHECVPASETPPREPGVEYERTFDRCVPSLVAFSDEPAARDFMTQRGGHLLTYAEAVQSIKKR